MKSECTDPAYREAPARTFASWLVMRGASIRDVSELLGHQSMQMTQRYAHLSPGFLKAETSLLDDLTETRDAQGSDEKGNCING